MNDILPPKRPLGQRSSPRPPQAVPRVPPAKPLALEPPAETKFLPAKTPRTNKKIIAWAVVGLVLAITACLAAAYIWYKQALLPVDATSKNKISVDITSGSSPDAIGELLENKKLIRSKIAFDLYTRFSNTRSKLQAGTYSLSPSESTEAIVAHMAGGKVDSFSVTFLPGATVEDNKKVLTDLGYSETEVSAAFSKTYSHPLFTDKPEGTDLEGYVYGETYNFGANTSVEKILTTTFDHYLAVIKQNNLAEMFKQQKLNLYQGITLASIIQKEESKPDDQKQIAQVFLRRLAIGMPLGADPTYKYAAKKLGVEPTPELDSPYNTRKVTGLPPGPISSPGKNALLAVANPASGDYLYFLSGDDNVTYFAHTVEQHETNIRNHCQVKCSVF